MTHYWAAALPSRQEKQKQENEREWCLFPELNPSVGLSVFPRPWGEKRKASWASFLPSLLNHSSSNCLIILKTYQGFSSWLCLCVWQYVCVCEAEWGIAIGEMHPVALTNHPPPTTPSPFPSFLIHQHPPTPHYTVLLHPTKLWGGGPPTDLLCSLSLILIIKYGDWVHAPQQLFRINWILLKHFA